MTDYQFNPEIEVWKAIPDFPGYEVSDHGRVRSYWHRGVRGPTQAFATIRKQYLRGRYLFVPLQQNTVARTQDVHRLVLLAFRGSCPTGMEACHNDGNRFNNHLSNLRWDTPLNNTADKKKHGTQTHGENHGTAKLSDNDILEIIYLSSIGYKGIEIARKFNVTPSLISLIVNKKHRCIKPAMG